MLDFEVHFEAYGAGELHLDNIYKPVPAIKVMPDWYKRLEPETQGGRTAKSCRGVYDIISAGYMYLWPFDVDIFKHPNGKLDIRNVRTELQDDFSPHPHFQLEGYHSINLEKQQVGVHKLVSPYTIKTPKGTSLWMTQPAYHPHLKVTVMPGILDTDIYYGQFNVLFTINDFEGSKPIRIKAGTPLAQIIPFVRGDWQLKFGKLDQVKREETQSLANKMNKFYQRFMWSRKVFKDESN